MMVIEIARKGSKKIGSLIYYLYLHHGFFNIYRITNFSTKEISAHWGLCTLHVAITHIRQEKYVKKNYTAYTARCALILHILTNYVSNNMKKLYLHCALQKIYYLCVIFSVKKHGTAIHIHSSGAIRAIKMQSWQDQKP
jgi:uncharacterized membrane protein YwzB